MTPSEFTAKVRYLISQIDSGLIHLNTAVEDITECVGYLRENSDAHIEDEVFANMSDEIRRSLIWMFLVTLPEFLVNQIEKAERVGVGERVEDGPKIVRIPRGLLN